MQEGQGKSKASKKSEVNKKGGKGSGAGQKTELQS